MKYHKNNLKIDNCNDKKKKYNSPIIRVKNLSFSFNKNLIFDNVSFDIYKKDMVAIIGPNGVGKSTLVKLLLGLLNYNNNYKNDNIIRLNGKISYIPQKFNQDVNFPALVSELLDIECCKCVNRDLILKSLNVLDLENKQFKDLSGGQQQRVLIAISLLSNPDILILDEPTVGIDSKSQMGFYNILKNLNKSRDLTILFITHDISVISNYFNKILCIYDKKICLDDSKNIHLNLYKVYGDNFQEINSNHILSESKNKIKSMR